MNPDPTLTPELRERLTRMAKASGRTEQQVLCEALQEFWIRFACRSGLKAGEW